VSKLHLSAQLDVEKYYNDYTNEFMYPTNISTVNVLRVKEEIYHAVEKPNLQEIFSQQSLTDSFPSNLKVARNIGFSTITKTSRLA
jgi:hypothetical protein